MRSVTLELVLPIGSSFWFKGWTLDHVRLRMLGKLKGLCACLASKGLLYCIDYWQVKGSGKILYLALRGVLSHVYFSICVCFVLQCAYSCVVRIIGICKPTCTKELSDWFNFSDSAFIHLPQTWHFLFALKLWENCVFVLCVCQFSLMLHQPHSGQ